MVISSSKYVVGTEIVNGSYQIPNVDRQTYMTQSYLKLLGNSIQNLKLDGSVGLLIAGGPASHHSESRVIDDKYIEGSVVIKSQLGYSTYLIAKVLGIEFDYININTNTCSSSMHCIYEAYRLIHNEGYDHVVVVAMEQTEESQLLLFKQLNIDLVCGDGVAFAVFSSDKYRNGMSAVVDSVAFTWRLENHPMYVSMEGYLKLISKLNTEDVNIVKPHGTGTGVNELAEKSAILECLPNAKVVGYKELIGHTQGASSLIELLMLVEELQVGDKAIVLASGLGGFYGGCTVSK